jgi:Domain of unknown function (DUF5753)
MVSTGNPIETRDARGPAAFDRLREVEQTASQIFLNQPLFVPGLLQVAGYAAEMIGRIAGLKPGDAELSERVAVRMRRADAFESRLRGGTPPHLWVPLDEAALRRAVGGPEVMRDQLDRLAALSRLSTVHLGIVPLHAGAHPGLGGSFEVHEMDGGAAAVFFEAARDDELVATEPALARQCRETVRAMLASAVTGDDARALLEAIKSAL